MLIRTFRERWLNLARENGLLRFAVGALCVTVILQGCYMKKLSERTAVHVHVPEYLQKDFSLDAAGTASLSYTEQWALSLLPFIASFTAETVDFNIRQFLLYVHPEIYHPISGFLLEKSKEIKTSGVAQAFFPKTVAVEEEGSVVDGKRKAHKDGRKRGDRPEGSCLQDSLRARGEEPPARNRAYRRRGRGKRR